MNLEQVRIAAAEAAQKALAADTVEQRKEIFESAFKDAQHNTVESKLKVGSFFKALANNDQAVLKDLSVGTDANGGYLTPLEFSGMLIEKLYKLPVIRPFATRMPMSSDKLEVPTELTTVAVNWTAELGTITQSDPTFSEIVLSVNELIGISRMSRQLLNDSAIQVGLVDWIVSRFAAAIGRAEDTAFMVGTGTGQPKGIRTYTISQSVAQAGGALTGDDLISLYYALPIQYRKNAVFLLHDAVAAKIRKLKDSSGRYLWSDNFITGGLLTDASYPTILGRPVLIQNDIPVNLGAGTNASEIYFGDLSFYLIGDRDQIFSEVSTQEGTSFAQHRAAVKVGERIDGQLSLTESFAKLTAVI